MLGQTVNELQKNHALLRAAEESIAKNTFLIQQLTTSETQLEVGVFRYFSTLKLTDFLLNYLLFLTLLFIFTHLSILGGLKSFWACTCLESIVA